MIKNEDSYWVKFSIILFKKKLVIKWVKKNKNYENFYKIFINGKNYEFNKN